MILLSCLCCLSLSAQPSERFYQAPSTKRMAELLTRIYQAQDFRTDPNKDSERAAYYRAHTR